MTSPSINLHISNLKKKITQLEKGFALAVSTVETLKTKRIFSEGKSSEGADIGKYDSTHELYVEPAKMPRKRALKGKSGQSKFKSGKPHKTAYFKSYKDFRAAMGRRSDKVNLVLTGQLQSDIRKGLVQVSPFVWESRITNPVDADKVAGIRARYGDGVFKLSKSEREKLNQLIKQSFNA